MDVSFPYASISPSLDGEVLVTLAGSAQPLTGREVARRARRGSQQGVNLVLRRLAQQGVVSTSDVGAAVLYSLNRDHLVGPIVEQLAELRNLFLHRVRASVAEWSVQPSSLLLFGSAARGDGDINSDIDLLVIRPAKVSPENDIWQDQTFSLSQNIRRWTGNNASFIEISYKDLPRLRRQRPRVVEEVIRDAITIVGQNPQTLFEKKRKL